MDKSNHCDWPGASLNVPFSARKQNSIYKILRKRKCDSRTLYLGKLSFKFKWREILSRMQKLRTRSLSLKLGKRICFSGKIWPAKRWMERNISGMETLWSMDWWKIVGIMWKLQHLQHKTNNTYQLAWNSRRWKACIHMLNLVSPSIESKDKV